MSDFATELNKLISNLGIFCEIWSVDEYTCEVYVDCGDWKHDHRRLIDSILAHGYDYTREITDEREDDCFSACYTITREVA